MEIVKVVTPIGAVVEVDKTVYENNKATLKLYKEEKQKKESRPVYSLRMPAWAIAFIKQNEVNVEKIILSAIEKEVSKNARKGA